MLKAIIFDFDGVIADTFRMCLDIHKNNERNITTKRYRDFHNGNGFFEFPLVLEEISKIAG